MAEVDPHFARSRNAPGVNLNIQPYGKLVLIMSNIYKEYGGTISITRAFPGKSLGLVQNRLNLVDQKDEVVSAELRWEMGPSVFSGNPSFAPVWAWGCRIFFHRKDEIA